ncbi:MAG: methylenetetrahydrofolate reductase, partial [Oscillospiraceae bacterium]|nr:methylenetetrahydrofolate reductase [Oscillospiraceae bacterium]
MKIKDLFGQGRPVFSCEVFPPKKTSPVDSIYKTLDGLKDIKPDFISVTFGAGGSQVNQSTREIASIIQNKYDIPAMAHLTCVNATKGEVTALLAGLKADGVENVLALRGPHTSSAVAGRVGRGGARECREKCPTGRCDRCGLCD